MCYTVKAAKVCLRISAISIVLCLIITGYLHFMILSPEHNMMIPSNIKDYMKGLIHNQDDIVKRNKGYNDYSFNILISDRIGYHRDIPDTRSQSCLPMKFPPLNLSASIIICFHNEAWSVLLRTIHSIVSRTKEKLLKEIILIDDYSNQDMICDRLSSLSAGFLSKVHCLRSSNRLGLIKARMDGAREAKGDVLIFLDSHIEVNRNWLEPLLSEIQIKKQTVTVPLIDIINADTFQYKGSSLVKGSFDWSLSFQWEDVDDSNDGATPYFSPTMSGGLFAIDREFFFHLGGYDEQMQIWGGENIEMSFRIWMCGGLMKIVPCSRVGHVFRNKRPYDNAGLGDVEGRNTVRLVEVWLDDFKDEFYAKRPDLKVLSVDVTDRKKLRENLKCNSFKWYLHNVHPSMLDDNKPLLHIQRNADSIPKILHRGQVINEHSGECLDISGDKMRKKMVMQLKQCGSHKMVAKLIEMNSIGEIKLSDKFCIDALSYVHDGSDVYSMKCDGNDGSQMWIYDKPIKRRLYNPASGMCLSVNEKKHVVMSICRTTDVMQKWHFRTLEN